MDNIYLLMIAALVILAITDLIVGVSNDAVNFLNSAIGSKAVSFKTIMIVASLGVAVGAIFSSGMMEVARKGIFNPGEFYFDEIMIIFMAVMITDILLLDFFNTLGLPTSTTVSIVFELLGAAVAMALIKIYSQDGHGIAEVLHYINTEKALEIIRAKLFEAKQREQAEQYSAQRRSLIGSGDRSEKIRTYNFPQSRITDHRIGFTTHNMDGVFDGDVFEITEALQKEEMAQKLEEAGMQ